jgi:hypothetical protein
VNDEGVRAITIEEAERPFRVQKARAGTIVPASRAFHHEGREGHEGSE